MTQEERQNRVDEISMHMMLLAHDLSAESKDSKMMGNYQFNLITVILTKVAEMAQALEEAGILKIEQ